jgi:hypothetical protein
MKPSISFPPVEGFCEHGNETPVSIVTAQLATSQEGLSSMKLFT